MSKWITPIAAVAAAALTAFADPIQALIASHPGLAGVFALLGVAAASFAPQPHK
jgi:hypothetical protein